MIASIIINTRNRPKLLLKRSLPSVLNQTFKDYEIIVVDDASEKDYGSLPVRYIKNKERIGLYVSRNVGVDHAKGEYIVFLDDDNEIHPDYLEKTIKALSPGISAVGVGKIIKYPEGEVYQKPLKGKYFSINDGFLIKKEAFQEIRGDGRLQANEDADFGLRFLQKFKVGWLDAPLMKVYASPIFNKTSYSDYTDYHLEGMVDFWKKHLDFFKKNPKENSYIKAQIGRYFILSSGRMKWFRAGYWLQEKYKRYKTIWLSQKPPCV